MLLNGAFLLILIKLKIREGGGSFYLCLNLWLGYLRSPNPTELLSTR